MLGFPRVKGRKGTKDHKKWSTVVAEQILRERAEYDPESVEWYMYFDSQKKKDDCSDVVIQLQAYKVQVYLDHLDPMNMKKTRSI